MKLHLGFESVSYSGVSRARRYGAGKTTRQVSKDLEDKYKIVDTFYEMNEDYIVKKIEEQAAIDLDEIMTMGKPSKKGLSMEETDHIQLKFRRDLLARKYDGVIPGVPTLASIRGVSHTRQHPYAKGFASRPSFVDTGTYSKSFRVWLEED